ncbi:GcrA family cell cycle regulator [Sphingomonas prati]|uniref:GcrA cell cycle regulator n=1 Tax=Sphingomonas prati TaxID=1843237 RepID=A0A7W9BP90_9SPHN|nr:GcrA family cell cycle regulator [Sphingomonas prati]MBB5727572.1 GcrA cell cycle regulator [Sphingomonas prati]
MSWTDERIEQLRKLWEAGNTASQIAEELGGVSRNAVIGKAHRLGLQSRPSPVRSAGAASSAAPAAPAAAAPVAPAPVAAPVAPPAAPAPVAAPVRAAPAVAPTPAAPTPAAAKPADEPAPFDEDDADTETDTDAAPVRSTVREIETAISTMPVAAPQPVIRSVGPGGFLRQGPGDQQPPATPAPPRRLVPAKPSSDIAGKTGLLDLSDKICKWPIGHPGEPDFHFCGKPINPGFPYCLDHCSVAYQAQLPRRDRRPPPPLPFGGPRVR